MDVREIYHIRKHLDEILKKSSLNVMVLSILQSKFLLSDGDRDKLNSIGSEYEKMDALLKILETREGAYKHLVNAFKDQSQSGVVAILNSIDYSENIIEIAKRQLSGNQLQHEHKSTSEWPHKVFGACMPDKCFTGRKEELQEMYNYLAFQDNSGILSLVGLGGIGKTQLAKMYIKNNKGLYKYICWINAEHESSVQSIFRKIAIELNIPLVNEHNKEREFEFVVRQVYSVIERENSLLVFDNAELSSFLSLYLPERYVSDDNTTLKVICTSRDRDWVSYGKRLEVQGFSKEDAITYIRQGLTKSDESESDTMLTLAEKLQFFPLALNQAVAYIREIKSMKDYSIADYLEEFERNTIKLLEFKSLFETQLYNDYQRTTFTTWLITLEKIKSYEEIGILSTQILTYCSYMLPEYIESAIFLKIPNQNEENILKSVRLLVKFSMLDTQDKQKHVNIHRLVQEVIRLREREKANEEKNLVELFGLLEHLPERPVKCCENFIAHLLHVYNYGVSNKNFLSRYKEYALILVCILTRISKLSDAVEHGKSWANALSQILKPNEELYCDLQQEIANACLRAGKFTEAVSYVEMALKGYKILDNINTSKLIENRRIFAEALMKLGKNKEALEVLLEVLNHFNKSESKTCKEKEDYANLLSDIGNHQSKLGNYDKGLDSFLSALNFLEEDEVKNMDKVRHVRFCIALVHGRMGRIDEAIQGLQNLIESLEKNDPKSKFIVNAAPRLAVFLNNHVDNKQAEKLFKLAFEICEKKLGALHPRTITWKSLHANVCQENNNLEDAKSYRKVMYYEMKQFLGEEHFKTQLAKARFAASWVDSEINNVAEAEYVISGVLQKLGGTDVALESIFFDVQMEFAKILKLQKKFGECKAFLNSVKARARTLKLKVFDTQPLDVMLEEIEQCIEPQIQRLDTSS